MMSGPNFSIARAATSLRKVSTEIRTPGPDPQLHAPPLLVGRDFVGAGARRIAPHVDDRGAFGGGLLHAAFDMRRVGHAAAGEERVGGDVQDRHHLRPGEVEINVVLLHG